MGLLLRAVDVAGPHRWRWLLVDEGSGAALADHPVDLDPRASETEAFEDLYRFLRWRADPDRRVASETELVGRVGAWIGSAALGEQIGRAIVGAAPVTVRVQVPAGAEFLAFRPWELAHVGGVPLAARGDVALVYGLPSPAGVAKAPVADALRMLAVFSLPTATSALALRRERYELSQLVRRVAARGRRRVELEVAQYGVTRDKLADLAEAGNGWDVLHLSGHGGTGEFLLERSDGSPDPVSTAELIRLLRPLRPRVKLAVVSACQSAAATTAETLRWLGLDDPAAELEAQTVQDAGQATPVGVARALVAELGCAVVAMRYPVIDDFAVGFADALYDRLFRHSQPLDRAVAAAVLAAAGSTASGGPAGNLGGHSSDLRGLGGWLVVGPSSREADLGPCRAGDGPVSAGAATVRRPRRGNGRRQRRPGPGVRAHCGGVSGDGRSGQDRMRTGAGLSPPAGLRGAGVLVGPHRPRPVRRRAAPAGDGTGGAARGLQVHDGRQDRHPGAAGELPAAPARPASEHRAAAGAGQPRQPAHLRRPVARPPLDATDRCSHRPRRGI